MGRGCQEGQRRFLRLRHPQCADGGESDGRAPGSPAIVAVDLPADPLGNYRQQVSNAPATNTAASSFVDVYGHSAAAPADDIDGNSRPWCTRFDAGAFELHYTGAC